MPQQTSPSPTTRLDAMVHAALGRATGALAQLAATQAPSLTHDLRDCLLAGPGEARTLVEPPRMGSAQHKPLADAPGSYVLEK